MSDDTAQNKAAPTTASAPRHEKFRTLLVKYGKFPGPSETELVRAAYDLGQDDVREECAALLEEMAMKYEEVVRWALRKGAQVIRERVLLVDDAEGRRITDDKL